MAALAIFPWGDVVEEFLDPLGLTYEAYVREMSGGWLFGYAAALQGQGRRVVIVHASEKVDALVRLIHPATGVPVWFVPGRRTTQARANLRAVLQWARSPLAAFRQVLAEEGCDAILIQDYEHARFDALTFMAARLGLPVYASFQGGDVTLSPLERKVRPRTLTACTALIVASGRERDRLKSVYGLPDARIHDVPNPVDVKLWRAAPKAAARARLGVDRKTFLVCNHGRIDIGRKGLDLLLEAWKTVKSEVPHAQLALVGSGQDHEAFAALAGGVPGLTWLSSYTTDRGLIRDWLSAADAYVTLSRVEGMPVAPLEAMACGLPIVASDAHGLADIFRQGEATGGLLIPGGEPQAAAASLIRLSQDAALAKRLGDAARRAVEDRYTFAAVGRGLADAFAK